MLARAAALCHGQVLSLMPLQAWSCFAAAQPMHQPSGRIWAAGFDVDVASLGVVLPGDGVQQIICQEVGAAANGTPYEMMPCRAIVLAPEVEPGKISRLREPTGEGD